MIRVQCMIWDKPLESEAGSTAYTIYKDFALEEFQFFLEQVRENGLRYDDGSLDSPSIYQLVIGADEKYDNFNPRFEALSDYSADDSEETLVFTMHFVPKE